MSLKRKPPDSAIDVAMCKKAKTKDAQADLKEWIDAEKALVMAYVPKKGKKKDATDKKAWNELCARYVTEGSGDDSLDLGCTCGHTFTKLGLNEVNLVRHLQTGKRIRADKIIA